MTPPDKCEDLIRVIATERVDVNMVLTVFLLAHVMLYSNQVQQPRRATAILASRPHTRQAARFDHEQDRASSYGSGGSCRACLLRWLPAPAVVVFTDDRLPIASYP